MSGKVTLQFDDASADVFRMETNAAESEQLETRVRAAKRSVTSAGMRVGRTGAMISTAGAIAVAVSWQLPSVMVMPFRILGGLALIFGLLPFSLGWQQAKAGSPFLVALNTPDQVEALFMEEKPLAGDRRSVSVLTGDGRSQSVALPAQQAGELFALLKELRPDAQCDVVVGAQRALAAIKP
jgi:hypothetical protein